jgi:uncharacterized membrane protein YgaE (UPF0421/DUF939 family)
MTDSKRDLSIMLVLFYILVWMIIIRFIGVDIGMDRQDIGIEQLKADILKIQQQVNSMAKEEELAEEAANLNSKLQDLNDRLQPVEDDQKFYKEIWREYFGMKRPLP